MWLYFYKHTHTHTYSLAWLRCSELWCCYMLTKLASVQCVGVSEDVWCEVLICLCVCVWNLLAPRLFQCKSRQATVSHRTNINTQSGGETLIRCERSATKWAKSNSVSDQKKAKNGFIEWEERRYTETQTDRVRDWQTAHTGVRELCAELHAVWVHLSL